MILLFFASIGFIASHCCARKPTKNRNQSVMSLDNIVAVAAIPAGTPSEVYSVVMVISGSPTSKGMPMDMDLTARTMAEVMRITLHETGCLRSRKITMGL